VVEGGRESIFEAFGPSSLIDPAPGIGLELASPAEPGQANEQPGVSSRIPRFGSVAPKDA